MVSYLAELDNAVQGLGAVVYAAERRGVPIDLSVCHDISAHAGSDAATTRAWLDDFVGTKTGRLPADANWNYALWLTSVLHDPPPNGLGLAPSPYWSKGRLRAGETSTDARAIEYLASINPEHREFLNGVRRYRRQLRVVGYANDWIVMAVPHPDGTWRLHPSWGMGFDDDTRPGARTGRFGLKNPALQQAPRDPRKDPYGLRRAFVAPPGHRLVVADYSQLEVVILAHLCVKLFGTRILADKLAPGQPDLHSATARFVFGEVLGRREILDVPVGALKKDPQWGKFRDQIKAVRYGLNYEKGEYGFGNTLFELDDNGEISGPPLGEERAGEMIRALFAFDPEIKAYQEWTHTYIKRWRAMPTLAGRWLPLPGLDGDPWEVRRAERQASNVPMQGGGQEITGRAMVRLHAQGFALTLQVHDELHAIVPEDRVDVAKAEMKYTMEHAWPLEAYLKAEPSDGANWMDAK